MLTGLSSKFSDTEVPAFAPATHLLNTIKQILNSKIDTQIILPGHGEITILPQRQQYHANIQDIVEFSTSPSTSFETIPLSNFTPTSNSASGKDIRELLWQLAFYAYDHKLIENCSENDVVQFIRWPNLTRLPVTANTARICALLTRHPTSIMLVRRVLGIDRNEVNRIISAAYSAGIVKTVSHGPSLLNSESLPAEGKSEQKQKSGLWNSLFTKISSL